MKTILLNVAHLFSGAVVFWTCCIHSEQRTLPHPFSQLFLCACCVFPHLKGFAFSDLKWFSLCIPSIDLFLDLGEPGFLVLGPACCLPLSVEAVLMGLHSVSSSCVALDLLCGEPGCRWPPTYHSWVWGLVGTLGCAGSTPARPSGVFWRGCCPGAVCVGSRRPPLGFSVCSAWGLAGEPVWPRPLAASGSGAYLVSGGRRRRREGPRAGGVNLIV